MAISRYSAWAAVGVVCLAVGTGCAAKRPGGAWNSSSVADRAAPQPAEPATGAGIVPAAFEQGDSPADAAIAGDTSLELAPFPAVSLADLEQWAVDRNPTLVRLYREYLSAAARTRYVDKLPDPLVGATVFGDPIETAAGSQRANVSVSQAIPWLAKLNAEEQRACFEAFAISADYRTARLKTVADVRTSWYRLYVSDRKIDTTLENQRLLQSLIDVANARIATGTAGQGDVLLGTLHLSELEERLLTYRRQRTAIEAELNRLVAQPSETKIVVPTALTITPPAWTLHEVYQTALQVQPEIQAAHLRTQATRWGIEVARLSRRPTVTLSASYYPTDDNRPPTNVVDVGNDPWSVGVHMTVPLSGEKYRAMQDEATWKHFASHDSVQAIYDRYDALILEWLSEARRAAETAELYEHTIIPQARQTLEADQESYSEGTVEFDRVVEDFRSLLTLELGYHQAIGDLAVAVAQLRRAAGQDLSVAPATMPAAPPE